MCPPMWSWRRDFEALSLSELDSFPFRHFMNAYKTHVHEVCHAMFSVLLARPMLTAPTQMKRSVEREAAANEAALQEQLRVTKSKLVVLQIYLARIKELRELQVAHGLSQEQTREFFALQAQADALAGSDV
jgi:hypothetical protein